MAEGAYQPDRGHFVWLNFSPQAGHEQAEHRPGLVLSPKNFNIATGFIIVCPVTNTGTGSAFEVPIPRGARLSGYVLSHHVRSLDWIARNAKYHSDAGNDLMCEVLGRVEAILEIDLGA